MIKITKKINDLPSFFTKLGSIIIDNVDDKLYWFCAVAIYFYLELISATEIRSAQIAKQMLLKKYGINYSNHLAKVESKKSMFQFNYVCYR